MKKWVRNSLPYLAYLILTIAYFSPVIIPTILKNPGNMVIVGDDLLGALGYDRIHLINAFKNGVIPWWNPFIHNGLTFHALACGQFFYPFTLLHLVMPVLSAFTVNYMVHVFLAGAGMFLFIRALGLSSISAFISGLIFMFCGYVPSYIYGGHFPQLFTFIWVPWYFYAFEKAINNQGKKLYKYMILGSVFVALSLLAGHWQFVVMGMGGLLFYALLNGIWAWLDGQKFKYCSKPVGILLIFVIGGIVLSAAQAIPTLVDMNYTIRAAREATYNVVAGYVFRIKDVITFIIPFFENRIHWEDAGYMGVLPLFLAFYALIIHTSNKDRRKILFFLFLAVVALFLSFGNQTSFYAIYYFFKPLRTFRVPARFITMWMFGLSVLAGFGFDGLLKLTGSRSRKKTLIYALSLGTLFILAILLAQIYRPSNSNVVHTKYLPLIFIILSMISMLIYALCRRGYKALILFIILLITVDLFFYKKSPLPSGFSYLGSFDMTKRINNETWWLKPMRDVVDKEKDTYPHFRVNWSEQPILNMTYYPLTIKGTFLYDGPWNCPLTRVYEVQELAANSGGVHSSIYDLFGVRYVWAKEELDKIEGSKYRKAAENIFLNNGALPRAFLVYKHKLIENKDAIFQEMRNPSFKPGEVAIIEKDLRPDISDVDVTNISQVNILEYGFNKVVLDVKTERPGILVLTDAYHPGWRAYIDGMKTKVFPVDWAVRGIYMPEGEHIVKFYFFPWYYKLGIGISLASILLLMMAFIKLRYR